jgi:hypothetical protein
LLAGPRQAWDGRAPVALVPTDPGVVAVASLIVPGSGQLLLGQRRWPIYAAVEAVAWFIHLDRQRSGRRLRIEYRDVAWTVARAGSPEPRRDGDWEYYERLEHWITSGRFDADPVRAGLQPETDVTTFNGSVWALAADLFLPWDEGEGTSAFASALDYYERHAYPTAQLWDWTAQEGNLERYRALIDQSDEDLRTATAVLGLVVATHRFSAAGACVSARLGRPSPASAAATLRAGPFGPAVEWRVEIRRCATAALCPPRRRSSRRCASPDAARTRPRSSRASSRCPPSGTPTSRISSPSSRPEARSTG